MSTTVQHHTFIQASTSVSNLIESLKQINSEKAILEQQIRKKLASIRDSTLSKNTKDIRSLGKLNLHQIHKFKAHVRPVTGMAWSRDSRLIASVADDQNLVVWNSHTKLKEHYHILGSEDSYIYCVDFSPNGNLLALGGLNNSVAVCRINTNNFNNYTSNSVGSITNANMVYGKDSMSIPLSAGPTIVSRFKDHDDCVTGLKFLNDRELVSASSDRKCFLYDIEKGSKTRSFAEAMAGVTSVSLSKTNPSLFITSSSADSMVRLYDVRANTNAGLVEQFGTIGDNVGCAEFFPNGNGFACGTRESSLTLYDIRSGNVKMEEYLLPIYTVTQARLQQFTSPNSVRFKRQNARYSTGSDKELFGVESLSFSRSGRVLFITTQDLGCFAYDILKGEIVNELDTDSNLVQVSPDGNAVLTVSRSHNNLVLWTHL